MSFGQLTCALKKPLCPWMRQHRSVAGGAKSGTCSNCVSQLGNYSSSATTVVSGRDQAPCRGCQVRLPGLRRPRQSRSRARASACRPAGNKSGRSFLARCVTAWMSAAGSAAAYLAAAALSPVARASLSACSMPVTPSQLSPAGATSPAGAPRRRATVVTASLAWSMRLNTRRPRDRAATAKYAAALPAALIQAVTYRAEKLMPNQFEQGNVLTRACAIATAAGAANPYAALGSHGVGPGPCR